MTKRELMKRLRPYIRQQGELLGVILRHGGRLHQEEFNEEFSDFVLRGGKRYRRNHRFGFVSIFHFPQTGDWAKFLDLMQKMVVFGRVRLEGRLPDVYYCM